MRYHLLSVLFVLAAAPLGDLATPLTTLWSDMRVKHMWNTTPANWETLGHTPAGTTIDIHIAVRPHRENALIDVLYKVSNPEHPRHVLATPPLAPALTCATTFQIWRLPVQGTGS